MIEKSENRIMIFTEDKLLNINPKDIEQYLSDVKDAVEKGDYRIGI